MLWGKIRMLDPNKHGIYNKQEIDMKNKILTNLRTLIYFSLLVYSLLMMLLTTDNQWFVLVTMLALNFSDELDNR
jgi:hypothetical protein